MSCLVLPPAPSSPLTQAPKVVCKVFGRLEMNRKGGCFPCSSIFSKGNQMPGPVVTCREGSWLQAECLAGQTSTEQLTSRPVPSYSHSQDRIPPRGGGPESTPDSCAHPPHTPSAWPASLGLLSPSHLAGSREGLTAGGTETLRQGRWVSGLALLHPCS